MDKPILFEDYYDISTATYCENPALMIPVGVNHQGILEQVEITDKYWQHVVVCGHAGAGKSNYMHAVLASLLLNYSAEQLNIWLEDGGMCEYNRFANTAPEHVKRVNTCSEPESYIAFIDALEEELDNRLKYLASVEKNSFYACYREVNKCPFPRLVVMIDGFDHFARFLFDTNHHHAEKMEHILRRASACGMAFIVSTQEAMFLAQHISRSFFELFGIRIATRQSSDSYSILFNPGAIELARDLKLGEMITSVSPNRKMNMLYISSEIERQIIEKSK